MTTISKGDRILTLINIFRVAPDRQEELVRLLSQATQTSVRLVPGFVSASLHQSLDGTKVVMYAQWRSIEDYQAMRSNPATSPYLQQALALAEFEPGMYKVAETFAPAAARPHLPLELLPDTLAICRLEPGAPIPSWAAGPSPFLTLSRTAEELSITTLQTAVPTGVPCERDYRALRVRGPLPLNLIGIVAAIADPLAAAGLSIFAISTFDTDYVLVKARELEQALQVLRQAGHQVTR
jgi:quinol monooxygenase YgiN